LRLTKANECLKEEKNDLAAANETLTKRADQLTGALQKLQKEQHDTIQRLILVTIYKDDESGAHVVRVSRYAAFIAEKIGLNAQEVHNIKCGAALHDIGKIGIPDGILFKPAKLTAEEFELVKLHTVIGANILSESCCETIRTAREIAPTHHEKWNGRGYPHGLGGESIPLTGRICALADVFLRNIDSIRQIKTQVDCTENEVALAFSAEQPAEKIVRLKDYM